jgi:phosphate butyryltransferase
MIKSFQEILNAAKKGGAKKLVISSVGKTDVDILNKVVGSCPIIPYLIGDGKAIETMIKGTSLALLEHEIMDEKDPDRALSRAIGLVQDGRIDMLMQGTIAHQALINAILDAKNGLRKGKLVSYISVFQLLKQDKLILVTDTFINNSPTISEKQLILENGLRLAGILEIDAPKVAALAAIEQINLSIPSTLDAAILSKMSERKQFGKAIIEGPLDIDCALSQVAAERKGIQSVVTGNVNIYLVPEIDTGHLLAESLVFFGKMQMAGAIMGTANPVILNIPFVSDENKVVEIALAALICGKGGNDG